MKPELKRTCAALALIAAACGSDTSHPIDPDDLIVEAIEIASTQAAGRVAEPIEVRVRLIAVSGRLAAGQDVSFSASGDGSVQPSNATTNNEGVATTSWTLGTVAGTQRLQVVSGSVQREVRVTAHGGVPAGTPAVSGGGQRGVPGSALPLPLVVELRDRFGNGAPGQPVRFAVSAGAGAVADSVVVTGVDGRASTRWTLGPAAGAQAVTASIAGVAPVTFAATALQPSEALFIAPLAWEMPRGERVTFSAWDGSGAARGVEWFVDGVRGGNAAVGGITAEGVFTASASASGSVTIRAVDPSSGASAESVVRFTEPAGAPATVRWAQHTPRVLNRANPDSLEVLVAVNGYASSLLFELAAGDARQLQAWLPGVYRIRMAGETALTGYREGDLHNLLGFLRINGTGGRYNQFVNVRDGTVPDAAVTRIGHDAQRTDYVLNLRHDPIVPGHKPELLARLYQVRPDAFDFVAVVDMVGFFLNRSFFRLRNDVTGIGMPLIDEGAQYGSPARLSGIINYPIDGLFDMGESAFSHEVGHRWVNFLEHPLLRGGRPHWPPSTLAKHVMGFSIPGSGAGGTYPFDVRPRGDGSFELSCIAPAATFSDLSLYLMGLIGPSDVGAHYVVTDPDAPRACGSIVQATRIDIGEVIAASGPRRPDHTASPRAFTAATIVLSTGRLLDADEMAFFTHMAQRGEARTELHYTSGLARGTTRPFFLATGGRATMTTRMW